MKTVITNDPIEAARFIRDGGLVAFPTETVYGLGANIFDAAAVSKIFEAKSRPPDNPLITHISDLSQVATLVRTVTPQAQKLIDSFFPGPLTIVLAKSERVPLLATAGLQTVGIRMPRLSAAQAFLGAAATPVAAPSANKSGRPSPTTWHAVVEDLDGRIDCILKGDATEIGLESTVVDCTGDIPVLLRQGAVSLDQLREVVPATVLLGTDDDVAARSPGLRHKHYSPRAKVKLANGPSDIEAGSDWAYIGLSAAPAGGGYVMVCSSVTEYAHALFEFFRECDRRGIGTIYCQITTADGLGKALMDRLTRAAAG